MFGIGIEQTITLLGYAGIFLLMIPNGIFGFPSSQILYIICGYFIFTGDLSIAFVVLAGAIGNTIGNIILYEAVRRKGISYVTKYKLFPADTIQKVERAFEKKGVWFLFFGKLTPALKVFAPIPPALGKMRRDLYVGVIFFSSLIWTFPFLAIGYYFGKGSDVFGKYSLALIPLALIILFFFYRYVERQPLERVTKDVSGQKKGE